MDPNAGWFAVAGALAAGVPQLVGVVVQSISARGQRTHDAEQADKKAKADALGRGSADGSSSRDGSSA